MHYLCDWIKGTYQERQARLSRDVLDCEGT